MKNYVIPSSGATRLSDRHVYLGPYGNTVAGAELAAIVMRRYREAGVPCIVIQSATAPELAATPEAVTELTTQPEYGLMCQVLTRAGSDSSNGGISATCRNVILLDERLHGLTATMKNRGQMPVRLWPPRPDLRMPAVRLGETTPNYIVARPVEQPTNTVGPMASGAWIVSDDARFVSLTKSHRPIPLHDRFETQALYDALTRD